MATQPDKKEDLTAGTAPSTNDSKTVAAGSDSADAKDDDGASLSPGDLAKVMQALQVAPTRVATDSVINAEEGKTVR